MLKKGKQKCGTKRVDEMISNRRTVDDDRWISNVFISLEIFSKALYLYCINLLWTLSCARCARPIIISVERGHQLNVRGYHKPKTLLHVLTTLSAIQPTTTTQIIWIEQIRYSTNVTAKKSRTTQPRMYLLPLLLLSIRSNCILCTVTS